MHKANDTKQYDQLIILTLSTGTQHTNTNLSIVSDNDVNVYKDLKVEQAPLSRYAKVTSAFGV